MIKKILYFFLLILFWIALTWSLAIPDLIAGTVVAIIALFLFSDLFPEKINYLLSPKRFIWGVLYIPVFIWQVIKSNFDVAYRVFHPDMPIRPGIVRVKTLLKTDIAKTFLANSITLTPGTLTVDCIDDTLYIHWINIISEDQEEETRLIVEKFESFLKKIFE